MDGEAIGTYLEKRVADRAIRGLAVVVTEGSDVLHVSGYGSANGWRPVTADTPMRIASLSKSFTAVAILKLVADGRVDLDAPVRRFLPGFTLAEDEATGLITVRHLLNQTGGLADRGCPELCQGDQRGPAPQLASPPRRRSPGPSGLPPCLPAPLGVATPALPRKPAHHSRPITRLIRLKDRDCDAGCDRDAQLAADELAAIRTIVSARTPGSFRLGSTHDDHDGRRTVTHPMGRSPQRLPRADRQLRGVRRRPARLVSSDATRH